MMATLQMPVVLLREPMYQPPKRKRGDEPGDLPRLSTTGFRASRADSLESVDCPSPSHKMARRFQTMNIAGSVGRPRLGSRNDSYNSVDSSTPVQEVDDAFSKDDCVAPAPTAISTTHTNQDVRPPRATEFTFESPRSTKHTKDTSSPPFLTSPSQFWQENEITGWSPDDPDEDNYGVNGVGYQKTPAVAYAISQKRKQQIADYRSRLTKEGRASRGQRRSNARQSKSPPPLVTSSSRVSKSTKAGRTVRFADT